MWTSIKNWFVNLFDVNKDGKLTAEDQEAMRAVADLHWRKANEKINEAVQEVKEVAAEVEYRVGRVKEEVADVVSAVKEVASQAGDVVGAAKGGKRKGRKK
tara:strand:- start:16091 stop:16393 length:303 start_codon:yes stop_codon:yes gene_type:complete